MSDPSSPPAPATPEPPHAGAWVPRWSGMGLALQKLCLIGGIALATLVPGYFVTDLVAEREARQAEVEADIAQSWGPPQRLAGPVLAVPFETADGARRYLRIAPAQLAVTVDLAPETRRRGLFQATVYQATAALQGSFDLPDETRLRELLPAGAGRLLWTEGVLALTVGGLAGLGPDDHVAIEGTRAPWLPCREAARAEADCPADEILLSGARLGAGPQTPRRLAFSATLALRGTAGLTVQSAARQLDAVMRAPWPSPSFAGNVLPTTTRVGADGFEARWQATTYGAPRLSQGAGVTDAAAAGSSVGVALIEAVPTYRMITRAAKYGLLLVVLSFATYLFFEVLARLRIHPVQYGLLGISLSLFALLLLSFGEAIGYTAAYAVSAGLVLAQSSIYTAAVARRAGPALVFAGILASLFAFLYVLLSLETYSLLLGALSLFVVVSVLMALTQRIGRVAGPARA